LHWFACIVLGQVVACSSNDVTSDAIVAPRTTDGGTRPKLPNDASSLADIGTGSHGDPTLSIDCVKAGSGARRDSSFLPGLFVAHIDLASYCATFECPYETFQDFMSRYACSPIDAGQAAYEQTWAAGCGLNTVGGMGPFGGSEYVFDATTDALVGAKIGSDTLFGPCNTAQYVAGLTSDPCASWRLYGCRARG
jgi:hypothetical protein